MRGPRLAHGWQVRQSLLERIATHCEQSKPRLAEKMAVYLDTEVTQAILLKPVLSNIGDCVAEVRALARAHYEKEETELWERSLTSLETLVAHG